MMSWLAKDFLVKALPTRFALIDPTCVLLYVCRSVEGGPTSGCEWNAWIKAMYRVRPEFLGRCYDNHGPFLQGRGLSPRLDGN